MHSFQVLIKFLLLTGPCTRFYGVSEVIQDTSITLKEITVEWRRQGMQSSQQVSTVLCSQHTREQLQSSVCHCQLSAKAE